MPILTIDDMTKRFQVDARTIYNWRQKMGLPYIKLGKVIYFREEAVNEWLLKQEKREIVAQ